jgi:endonuclease YncB( thermonuclease family)
MGRNRALVALAAGGVAVAGIGVGVAVRSAPSTYDDSLRTEVTHVIDGDTVEVSSGRHVRLIGVDTPERGECGHDSATRALRRMVQGRWVDLRNPTSVQDRDRYDRLLRYVDLPSGRDTGFAQIRAGRAVARYDSRDGYDVHPREDRYRRASGRRPAAC